MATARFFAEYLALPRSVAGWLGELSWSANGEAVELPDGTTFALLPQIGQFLDGFRRERPLIHFPYILQLLHLLGFGNRTTCDPIDVAVVRLRTIFRSTGKNLRNAGAFCAAVLCEPAGIPKTAALTADHEGELTRLLLTQTAQRILLTALLPQPDILPEELPLPPREFLDRITAELAEQSEAEITAWLKHGTHAAEPIGEQLRTEILSVKPPALRDILGSRMQERERLHGALPLLATLVSVLAIPPRRERPPELPLGGYVDVTNRGTPERLLPSQYALDDLEFIRRFAANELLYFKKEEPAQRTRDALVLLLDQGVRTWGPIRLANCAAVLALSAYSRTHDLPIRLHCSSSPGVVFDLTAPESSECLRALESSDLSADPLDLLRSGCRAVQEGTSDLVLLTHARNLHDPRLAAATADLPTEARLFALGIDDDGESRFGELRGGTFLPISRFRVPLEQIGRSPPVSLPASNVPGLWRGDVEPLGYPFRFGLISGVRQAAFSTDGNTLLTVSGEQASMHLWPIAGGPPLVLPRPFVNGRLLYAVEAIFGTPNGFAVCGRSIDALVVAHYQLDSQVVVVHRLASIAGSASALWHYHPRFLTITAQMEKNLAAIDLETRDQESTYLRPRISTTRAAKALATLRELELGKQNLLQEAQVLGFLPVIDNQVEPTAYGLLFRSADGAFCTSPISPIHQPQQDGRPLFKGAQLDRALICGNTILALGRTPTTAERFLAIFEREPNLTFVRRLTLPFSGNAIALSNDGTRFAYSLEGHKIYVDESGTYRRLFESVLGRCHNNLYIELADSWLLVGVGTCFHLFRWESGPLRVEVLPYPLDAIKNRIKPELKAATIALLSTTPRPPADYDTSRFRSQAVMGLRVVADSFGQLFCFDRSTAELRAVFFVRRQRFGIWLPDGTRFGATELIGGPATPNAAERIAAALRGSALGIL